MAKALIARATGGGGPRLSICTAAHSPGEPDRPVVGVPAATGGVGQAAVSGHVSDSHRQASPVRLLSGNRPGRVRKPWLPEKDRDQDADRTRLLGDVMEPDAGARYNACWENPGLGLRHE
jgi:hypothetical protein